MKIKRGRDGVKLCAVLTTLASVDQLASLLWVPAYAANEPHLRSARWLTNQGPRVGARAEVVADIPHTIGLVGLLRGNAEAVATVTEWPPPPRIFGLVQRMALRRVARRRF